MGIGGPLNSLGGQIENPRQHQGERKSDGDRDDEHLLGPIRSMEDRQNGPAHLNQPRSDDSVSQSHAINATPLQLGENGAHSIRTVASPGN